MFAPLQSDLARRLLAAHGGLPAGTDSIVVLDGAGPGAQRSGPRGRGRLNTPWPFLARLARLVPRGLRDAVYDGVARGRYRWFGRRDVCALPQTTAADRFLDGPPSAP